MKKSRKLELNYKKIGVFPWSQRAKAVIFRNFGLPQFKVSFPSLIHNFLLVCLGNWKRVFCQSQTKYWLLTGHECSQWCFRFVKHLPKYENYILNLAPSKLSNTIIIIIIINRILWVNYLIFILKSSKWNFWNIK